MGLFLVIASAATFFGPVTLEKAYSITEGAPITLEAYVEALEPITPLDYSKLNND